MEGLGAGALDSGELGWEEDVVKIFKGLAVREEYTGKGGCWMCGVGTCMFVTAWYGVI